MIIDADQLKGQVKPQIKNARKYLELGKNSINLINTPSDFSYSARLRSIPQSILNIDNKVSSVEHWLDTTISKFANVESSNKSVMDNLISALPIFVIGGGAAVVALTAKDAIDNIKSSIKNAFEFAVSGEWIPTAKEMEKKTAAKIGDKIESAVSWAANTGAKIKEEVRSIASKIESGRKLVGAKLSDGWDRAYQDVYKPSFDFWKGTGATVANAACGVVKGIGQFVESLADLVVMVGTGVDSIFTGIYDGVSYLIALSEGETDNWSSVTGEMWKNVMGYVAEDHVGNAFKSFYSNTSVGKWLDENSIDIFKSEGIGTGILSGVGYIAGIVAVSLFTARSWWSSCGSELGSNSWSCRSWLVTVGSTNYGGSCRSCWSR